MGMGAPEGAVFLKKEKNIFENSTERRKNKSEVDVQSVQKFCNNDRNKWAESKALGEQLYLRKFEGF